MVEMEEVIDPKILKLLRWAQQNINVSTPYAYDKPIIVDIANYIYKEHLSYNKDLFVYYANQLNFPKETIDVFVKEIEKASKRKSHPIKVIEPSYIISSIQ